MKCHPIPGLPRWLSGQEPACQCRNCRRHGFDPRVGKIPWRRKWQPTPVFLPGASREQRNLVGYSPSRHKESNMTERSSTHPIPNILQSHLGIIWGFVPLCPLPCSPPLLPIFLGWHISTFKVAQRASLSPSLSYFQQVRFCSEWEVTSFHEWLSDIQFWQLSRRKHGWSL